MKYIYNFLFILIIGISCTGSHSFEKLEVMPGNNWNRFKPIVIQYEAASSEKAFDIVIVTKYNRDYTHRRLNVMGTMLTPSGEERYREYYFKMNDSEGEPLGQITEDVPGETFITETMMYKAYSFTEDGVYTFEIENLMSKYDNPGIMELGIRILPSK